MVAEFIELIGKVVSGFFGLQYLFSSNYRKEVHKSWNGKSKLKIAGEIFEVILGLFLLGAIIYAAITYRPVT